jgi:hypothetical protein
MPRFEDVELERKSTLDRQRLLRVPPRRRGVLRLLLVADVSATERPRSTRGRSAAHEWVEHRLAAQAHQRSAIVPRRSSTSSVAGPLPVRAISLSGRLGGNGHATPEGVRSLLADLAAVASAGLAVPLADVVIVGSRAESFLRLSLLPLVGDARAGEGFAGQLGALPLDVEAGGDGWPDPVEGRTIAALTPGEVLPRAHGEARHG